MSFDSARNLTVVHLIAKCYREKTPEDLLAVIRELRLLLPENPELFVDRAIEVVTMANRIGQLEALSEQGLLSEMSKSGSGDVLRAAAFAFWRLGRSEVAAELQASSLQKFSSVESPLTLVWRVGSAISNYAESGSDSAGTRAWDVFVQLPPDADEYPSLALEFVRALNMHHQLGSEVAQTLLKKLMTLPAEQSIMRLVAFMAWRRGDASLASQWQTRSLAAPLSPFRTLADQYLLASANADLLPKKKA